jgi:hypothetical protein
MSANFGPLEVFAMLPFLDRMYFMLIISAVIGSAFICAQVVRATKRGDSTEPNVSVIIATRMQNLNALFRVALLASAVFVIDGVWNVCFVYMVLRATDGNPAAVLHFNWFVTQLLVLSLLAMEAMKWISSNAAARVRRNS